ncbi:MAG: hypothetical protein ACF8GE_04735 [Phycisphaerales bacterium JB043]
MRSSISKTALRLACAGLAVGLVTMSTAQAGYTGAMGGTGYRTGGVALIGPLAPHAEQLVNKIKADNPAFTEMQARQKAIDLHQGVCKAIDAVTAQNAVVGACLKKLKGLGSICISFNMRGAVGTAINDGMAACNAADKINISDKVFAEGCPPPHDPNLYWLTTTLLHEGTHAIQDYSFADTGDADKNRAAKNKKRMCNEAGTGVGADPKGAHVIENEWITQLKEVVAEVRSATPQSLLHWTPATQAIFNSLFNLPAGPAKTKAIDDFERAICNNKAGNDRAIECYRKGKQALQAFIDADVSTTAKRNMALQNLRNALNQAKWRRILSRFNIRKIQLSDATSGIIDQGLGEPVVDTGMLGISDMELVGDHLIVLGEGNVTGGSIRVYHDSDVDGVFNDVDLVTNHDNDPGIPPAGDLIVHPVFNTVMLFTHDTSEFFELVDSDFDGIPDQMNPVPVFSLPGADPFLNEWQWFIDTPDDIPNNLLVGRDIHDSMLPASMLDEVRVVLEDFNNDGIPDNDFGQQPAMQVVDYPPVPVLPPLPGDPQMQLLGFPGVPYEVLSVDPVTFNPIESLGFGNVPGIFPLPLPFIAPLSRPLNDGEVILVQTQRSLTNPLHSLPYGVSPCPNAPGDLNGDFVVNGSDLGLFLGAWGTPNPCTDLNNDGTTDGADLGLFLGLWGPVPA